MNLKRLLLVPIIASSFLHAEEEVKPSSWSYDIQLYMLAVWIKGDSQLGRLPQADVDVTPSDIFSNLNMGGMAHIEAHQRKGFGVWFDYAFMDLGIDSETGNGLVEAQTGVYQGILEAFATYRVPLKVGTIDYFGGVRWWHNNFELDLNFANQNLSDSKTIDWYDPIIGVRWIYPISEDWNFKARGDIGGFSIGSKFTSAVELGAMYDITESWQVDVRFKSLWVDYEEGTEGTRGRFTYKTVNYGPIIGITYRF